MTTAPIVDPRRLGVVEWFRPGEYTRVEESIARLRELRVSHLRTHVSWAEYVGEGGTEWYRWLLPQLAEFELLPCLHYTPPSLSETGRSSGPPRDLRAFADFVDHVISCHGRLFEAVELWNEPNNLLDWDWRVDTDWQKFCTMIGAAAYWAQQRGKRVVLGGPCPTDINWLSLMGERGVLGVTDVVGLHGFPGTWDSEEAAWPGWDALVSEVEETVRPYNADLALWVTETGYSTWRHDPFRQVERFAEALRAPVERVYWYALQDLAPTVAVQEGLRFDPRHYHFGLHDSAGRPKLLARALRDGRLDAIRQAVARDFPAPSVRRRLRPIVVTGGAGFIGSNLVDRLAREGHQVLVFDALDRPGVEQNLSWLKWRHRDRVSAAIADLRDADAVRDCIGEADGIFHLAAQVAVTTSLEHPIEDFEVNARGTLNLLEAIRQRHDPPPLVMASTNKVYGELSDMAVYRRAKRYWPKDPDVRAYGIPENQPLDFRTPYGCSKGVADQYVLDYARSFGLPTAVFRMSCIYGPHQFGTEDQGWVAHFLISAMSGRPITIYGDGCQVRDVLYVDDAVNAYLSAFRHIRSLQPRVFNLGGGPRNAVSLLQLVDCIGKLIGRPVELSFSDWRPGDQRYYVSDTRRVMAALRLPEPVSWHKGVAELAGWLRSAGLGRAATTPVKSVPRALEASA